MKNNFFKSVEYLYYLSLTSLLILYLFPGSLIGYFLYDNLGKQPNLVNNPIGTSINHLFYFIYLSALGSVIRLRNKKWVNSFQFLLFISIFLELTHYFIPSRAFEYNDLFANSAGVIGVFILSSLFRKKNIK